MFRSVLRTIAPKATLALALISAACHDAVLPAGTPSEADAFGRMQQALVAPLNTRFARGAIPSGGSNPLGTTLGVRLDAAGNLYAAFGLTAASVELGGVQVARVGTQDAYGAIVKFSPGGDLLWAKAVAGTWGLQAFDLALLPNGDVAFAAGTNVGSIELPDVGQTFELSGAPAIAAVGVVSGADGSLQWASRVETVWDGEAVSLGGLAVEPSGNVVFASRAGDIATWDSSGVDQGTRASGLPAGYVINRFAVDPGGNHIYSGEFTGPLPGASGTRRQAFIAKRDAVTHTTVWLVAMGSSEDGAQCGSPPCDAVRNSALAVGPAGEVFVAGTFETGTLFGGLLTKSGYGGDDGFVASFSAAGAVQWARAYGAPGAAFLPSVLKADESGRLHAWGMRFGVIPSLPVTPIGPAYDGTLLTYGPTGDLEHALGVGGPSAYVFVYPGTLDARGGRMAVGGAGMMGDLTQPPVSGAGSLQYGLVALFETSGPQISCPANVTVLTEGAQATVTYDPATSTEPSATIGYSQNSGTDFPVGETTVTATATGLGGATAQCAFVVRVNYIDKIAPVATCPADVTVEATGPSGATATFGAATATDNWDPTPVVTSDLSSGSVFALGDTTVTFTATDADSNQGTCAFTVKVEDTTAPEISASDLYVEATSMDGAVVEWAAPVVTDAVTQGLVATCALASGDLFGLGLHDITCTATDEAGNTRTLTFFVTVGDATPPSLTTPDLLTLEATGPGGAVGTYSASATDIVDGALTPTCAPASDSTFPLGMTTVTCEASDASGNKGAKSFSVVVGDTVGPVIRTADDRMVEAAGASGSVVTFDDAAATDVVSGQVSVTCDHQSGNVFPLGETIVTCSASDVVGNPSQKSFTITVRDMTAPSYTTPGDLIVEAGDATGALVTWTHFFATDLVDGVVAVTCDARSGDRFPLGVTTVACASTDAAGNTNSQTFTIRVADTTAPAITCPESQLLEAVGPGGSTAFYSATATDAVSTPTVELSSASGSLFALGATAVTATATDAAGNAASCQFSIMVVDTTQPVVTCPETVVGEATGSAGATVTFAAPEASDAVSTVTVAAVPQSGSAFALGETPVVVTATDGSGNAAICSFTVRVVDTTAPAPPCPDAIVAEAVDGSGAPVAFTLKAEDTVSTPSVTSGAESGSVFPVGTTTVSATSIDAAGNTSSCEFDVTVRDTVAPVITCPENVVKVVLEDASEASITWTGATATDAVSTPVIGYSHAQGSDFPMGETTVTATATDGEGNATSCTFTVTKQTAYVGGGMGCSSASPMDSSWLLLGFGALLRRRRKLGAAIIGLGSLIATSAHAQDSIALQDFSAERLRATLDGNGIIAIESATVPKQATVTAGLWVGYAANPVAIHAKELGLLGTPVGSRVGAGLSVGYSLRPRFQLGLELPLVLHQEAGKWPQAELLAPIGPSASSGLGDLRFVPKIALLTQETASVNLALVPGFTLPTGESTAYRGEPGITFLPEALVSRTFGPVRVGGSVIVPIRDAVVGGGVSGSELGLGLGAAYRREQFETALSVNGTTALKRPFQQAGESTLEARAQFAYALPLGLSARVGAGFGLGDGWGVPTWRVYGGIGWTMAPAAEAPKPEPVVAPPPPAPAPAPEPVKPVDTDGDGLSDDVDQCPAVAEDKDGFNDADGCADPDNDADGVPDASDKCAITAGPAENGGCPDTDKDGDTVVDRLDACVDATGVVSRNGCPEPDRDGDGVIDRLDNCPTEAGSAEFDGCKAKQLAVIKDGAIEIRESVFFANGKDLIEKRSFGLLDNVAAVLVAHPELSKVVVEGHTDNAGKAEWNQKLSEGRAAAVVKHLVKKGVAAERLESKGFGDTQPIADNGTSEGRTQNRRVVFKVVK